MPLPALGSLLAAAARGAVAAGRGLAPRVGAGLARSGQSLRKSAGRFAGGAAARGGGGIDGDNRGGLFSSLARFRLGASSASQSAPVTDSEARQAAVKIFQVPAPSSNQVDQARAQLEQKRRDDLKQQRSQAALAASWRSFAKSLGVSSRAVRISAKAFGGLTAATFALDRGMTFVTGKQEARINELRRFSGPIAQATAEREKYQIARSLRLGQATAGSSVKLLGALRQRDEAREPLDAALRNLGNTFSQRLTELQTWFYQTADKIGINDLADAINGLIGGESNASDNEKVHGRIKAAMDSIAGGTMVPSDPPRNLDSSNRFGPGGGVL